MENTYPCDIYRDATGGDCTNGGVSSRYSRALLLREPPGPGYKAPDDVAVLVLDTKPVGRIERVRAVPAGETRWVMFGGNFVWSCDSRFRQEVSERPIPIHDRIE